MIAHRGASADAPENTVEAFDRALDQGADVLEVDVRVTAAGELVCLHDATLERTTGDPRRADELVVLPEHPAAPPALETVLARYGPEQRFLVDLKEPDPEWEGRVVETIERHGPLERAVVQSFDHAALGRLRHVAPRLRLAALYRRADSVGLAVADIPRWASAVGVWHVAVDDRFVRAAHRRGLAVQPWTVDEEPEAARLAALGVDAVITNAPSVVAGSLRP